ncbi:MAG: plastocyanin/azurin family copper-binding protein [Balneolaceae bacterium]|nr:plastocyanin/azurin family copper-binding protein [Balneolaceae bacterium]
MNLLRLLAIILPMIIMGGELNVSVSEPSTGSPEPKTIEIIGIDKMKFVVARNSPSVVVSDSITTAYGNTYRVLEAIKVKPSQEVTIQLTTVSELPPRSMSHNWVLLTEEANPAEFDKEAVLAVDNNYIPPHKEDHIIARTALVEGGETAGVTFKAPQEQGMYDYLCSFPGHFANEMRGKLIVQK